MEEKVNNHDNKLIGIICCELARMYYKAIRQEIKDLESEEKKSMTLEESQSLKGRKIKLIQTRDGICAIDLTSLRREIQQNGFTDDMHQKLFETFHINFSDYRKIMFQIILNDAFKHLTMEETRRLFNINRAPHKTIGVKQYFVNPLRKEIASPLYSFDVDVQKLQSCILLDDDWQKRLAFYGEILLTMDFEKGKMEGNPAVMGTIDLICELKKITKQPKNYSSNSRVLVAK